MNSPGLSVVIPAYNEEKYLPETLRSIKVSLEEFSSEFDQPCEIIVVDNDSTDQTALVSESFGSLVVRETKRNISAVRNRGIRAAKYDICVTVDADSAVPRRTFSLIWQKMAGGEVIGGAVDVTVHTDKIFLKAIEWGFRTIGRLVGTGAGLYFFDRKAALEIEGFNEQLLVAEDTDFAFRLRAFGRTKKRLFVTLWEIQIVTKDRKQSTSWELTVALFHALRCACGFQANKKQLSYWYDPKR